MKNKILTKLIKKDGVKVNKKSYFENIMSQIKLSKRDDDNTKTY